MKPYLFFTSISNGNDTSSPCIARFVAVLRTPNICLQNLLKRFSIAFVSGFSSKPHISDKNNMISFTKDVNVSRSVSVEIKLQVDSLYTLPKALQ